MGVTLPAKRIFMPHKEAKGQLTNHIGPRTSQKYDLVCMAAVRGRILKRVGYFVRAPTRFASLVYGAYGVLVTLSCCIYTAARVCGRPEGWQGSRLTKGLGRQIEIDLATA